MNQDGHSNGLTAPSQNMQKKLIQDALHLGSLNSSEIDLLECHQTGTSLGDPIEMGAILSI